MFEIKGKYTSAKIMIDQIDESCMSQIYSFLNHSIFINPIAIMPDTHAGKGSVIGFTMEMTDKIIPNIVGVDIGCGINCVNVGKNLNLSFEELDHKIRHRIPFGQNVHEQAVIHLKKEFPWHKVNVLAEKFSLAYSEKFGIRIKPPHFDDEWFIEKCKQIGGDTRRMINSIGTMGGGNHFCEIGISESNDYWITIHSGSRNFGMRICTYWQNKGAKVLKQEKQEKLKELIKEIQKKYSGQDIQSKIDEAKKELKLDVPIPETQEWLENEMATGYLFDMIFAQIYAQVNRSKMIDIIMDILKIEPLEQIETIHNFIDFHDFIIRKGAIRSYKNEKMMIPFNMRDGILVCEGKSNPEWNFSAPHGAGRILSRSEAKKKIDLEKFKKQMVGIFSTSIGYGTLDEAPDAYKDSKVIEEAIQPTATIIDRIKPLHNMKDSLGQE